MKITLITVGKIKESYFRDAIAEYKKRLSRYGSLNIVEVPDEATPDSASPAEENEIRQKEGDRILKAVSPLRNPETLVTALAIEGKSFSSEELSTLLSRKMTGGVSHFVFIIGGSLGLSPEVLRSADLLMSFSRMTFPHQLMRVILLEQIYRGIRIMRNEPYHK